MESDPDLEGFLQQIRAAPLTPEMVNMILSRLNDAENIIAASAEDDEQPAVISDEDITNNDHSHQQPETAPEIEAEHGVEEFSVSQDSAEEIEIASQDDTELMYRNGVIPIETQAMYPISPVLADMVQSSSVEGGDQEEAVENVPEDVEVVSNADIDPYKCKQCEELKKSAEETKVKYDMLTEENEKLKAETKLEQRAKDFSKNCNGEGLDTLADSELTELERKLKGTLEKISIEKEMVFDLFAALYRIIIQIRDTNE